MRPRVTADAEDGSFRSSGGREMSAQPRAAPAAEVDLAADAFPESGRRAWAPPRRRRTRGPGSPRSRGTRAGARGPCCRCPTGGRRTSAKPFRGEGRRTSRTAARPRSKDERAHRSESLTRAGQGAGSSIVNRSRQRAVDPDGPRRIGPGRGTRLGLDLEPARDSRRQPRRRWGGRRGRRGRGEMQLARERPEVELDRRHVELPSGARTGTSLVKSEKRGSHAPRGIGTRDESSFTLTASDEGCENPSPSFVTMNFVGHAEGESGASDGVYRGPGRCGGLMKKVDCARSDCCGTKWRSRVHEIAESVGTAWALIACLMAATVNVFEVSPSDTGPPSGIPL